MRNLKNIYLFSLLMVMSYNIEIFGQASVRDNLPNLGIRIDSIFSYFETPKLPKSITENYSFETGIFDIRVLCIVKVDSNNLCKDLKIFPLYEYGNNLEENNQIWYEIVDSIKTTSKKWKFRELNHLIKDSHPKELKKFYKDINGGKTRHNLRPWSGTQEHIFILNYHLYFDFYSPDLLYWINCSD